MGLNLLNLYSLIFALFYKISDMTSDLEKFMNRTEPVSTNTTTIAYATSTTDLTTIQYYVVPRCYELCVDPAVYPLFSENLISDLAHNVSTYIYPKLIELASNLTSELDNLSNTSMDLFTTNFPDNSSWVNVTYDNGAINNTTFGNYLDPSLADLKNMFVDYFTYILQSFDNNTDETTIIQLENTSISTTVLAEISNDTGFNTFKSTIIPILLNSTEFVDTGRFDYELSTIYDDISTTISTFQGDITTISNCRNVCEEVSYPYNPDYDVSTTISTAMVESSLNYSTKAWLRTLCWETMFGQEMIKLTVMDLITTILPTLAIDFLRGIFVRVMNRCWCWDLEKKFPQYGDFKVAENILSLVNNQGMVWMGMFFSPGLVVLNVVKLYIFMYFRSWAVLTCNVPPAVIFRASRSNNFYYALLLMMLFLCVLPVGYAIVWIKPSWNCGPFSKYERIFHIFTKTIKNNVPEPVQKALDYIASPGIVIPLLVLLILIIYYLVSLTGALRGANEDLKIQLRRERTEERRKMFQMVDRRRRVGSGDAPFNKWKKLLGHTPSGKSMDDTPKQETEQIPEPTKDDKNDNKKDFFSKFIKRALGKSSISEDEQNAEDGTDTEQHDSLPFDSATSKQPLHRTLKPSFSWGNSDLQHTANRALFLKKSQGRLDNLARENEDADSKQVHINDGSSDSKKGLSRKDSLFERNEPSTPKNTRQDSEASVWSENIPVIKISKTESAENILDKQKERQLMINKTENSEKGKFKPKIKCVLKKQSTEIDEDTIRYFSEVLEKNITDKQAIKAMAEEDIQDTEKLSSDIRYSPEIPGNSGDYLEESLTDKSSSEDTALRESSRATVLGFPYAKEDH